jgi:putative ABC transport system ATP-binding protein
MAMISLNDVSMDYGSNGTRATALTGVSAEIGAGEYAVITGESGAGKSTLLCILGGLQLPTGGSISIAGTDLATLRADALADFRGKTIGFVFQAYHLLPYLTARENVMVPMTPERLPQADKIRRADALLASVGLSGKEDRLPSQLSGGECQRVAVARALVHDPPVLLADEPTGNLDSATGEQILDLFAQLHAQGKTILMVTHNRGNVGRGTRSIRLRDGRIDEDRAIPPAERAGAQPGRCAGRTHAG